MDPKRIIQSTERLWKKTRRETLYQKEIAEHFANMTKHGMSHGEPNIQYVQVNPEITDYKLDTITVNAILHFKSRMKLLQARIMVHTIKFGKCMTKNVITQLIAHHDSSTGQDISDRVY